MYVCAALILRFCTNICLDGSRRVTQWMSLHYEPCTITVDGAGRCFGMVVYIDCYSIIKSTRSFKLIQCTGSILVGEVVNALWSRMPHEHRAELWMPG